MTLRHAAAWPGAAAALVDALVFQLLTRGSALSLGVAHWVSFAVAAPLVFAAWSRGGAAAGGARAPAGLRAARFAGVSLLALLLRGGVLAGRVASGWDLLPALLAAEVAAAAVFAGAAFVERRASGVAGARDERTRLAVLAVCAYLVGLRLAYLGAVELVAQEAYYWNYAQHLAWSYLDHPPLTAWLIAASTRLLGGSEAAVRLPALLGWLVAAGFVFAYASAMVDRRGARFSLLLFAAIPFYFFVGFIITPDSTLVACWAAALLCFHRALVAGERRAWWGVAVAMGLGMLSKYTIALLAPAAIVFALGDASARRRLVRPEPCAAALLSLLLFTPVLAWNADHDWASFRFQGSERFEGPLRSPLDPAYAVHWLKSLLQLTVATGILPLLLLVPRGPGWQALARTRHPRADRRFVLAFGIVPALVFVAYAFRQQPRPNWMGPVWLAPLPVLGAAIPRLFERRDGSARRGVERAFWSLIAGVVLLYAAGLHGLVLGIPGLQLPPALARLAAWRDVGDAIARVECQLRRERGQLPLVIGADKYNESSLLAYYDGRRTAREGAVCDEALGARAVSARHLFGRQSLMYEFWSSPADAQGRDVILVSRLRDRVLNAAIPDYFARMDDPQAIPIRWGDTATVRFWYRIGYDFRLPPGAPPASFPLLQPVPPK